MTYPVETTYDVTRNLRTGRPILPIDTDNTHKAEAESLPRTDEDNQGIDIGEHDADGEEDDLPQELADEDAEEEDAAASSSVEVNSTVPRMKPADPENDEFGSHELTDDDFIDEGTSNQETLEGERPEALAKFAGVARNDDGKAMRNGTEAIAETAPIPTDPAQKQDAATRVLREGVFKRDQGSR